MLRIGMVVGEPSGDDLAAGLVDALREKYPDLVVEGILGPRLIRSGGHSLFPMSKLSVMGIIEVLAEYPELASIRNRLKHYFLDKPPDIFIGIDAPDFNLPLEEQLNSAGIRTVHYVSPSVWAWRRGRVKQVERASDKLLTLFPFESRFYNNLDLEVECVGHPLADAIPIVPDTAAARRLLGISVDQTVIALMPGSRKKELSRLARPFLETAMACYKQNPNLLFISNCISDDMKLMLQAEINKRAQDLPITLFSGRSHEVLQACDVALLASGTITLEAMLFKKPMVIGYKLSPLTYYIIRLLISAKWAGLPNILAQDTLVPEFYQGAVDPTNLVPAVMHWLSDKEDRDALIEKFTGMHESMKLDANHKAADAVDRLYKRDTNG